MSIETWSGWPDDTRPGEIAENGASMSSRERMAAAMRHQAPDRVPVMCRLETAEDGARRLVLLLNVEGGREQKPPEVNRV